MHDLINSTSWMNPFLKETFNGKEILKGHISDEHLENPAFDEELAEYFRSVGIEVKPFIIEKEEYFDYLKKAEYPKGYYGGGEDPDQNFTEKTLEHFVSTKFLNLNPDSVFIDIAACNSPFYEIVKRIYNVREAYQQDLIFPKGLNGDKIGGFASEIPLPDNSVDAVTLHCSLEHFEGSSDSQFFIEMARVLKPGGRVVVLPFYLAYEYTIHVDPAFNILKNHKVEIDDERARLRYCTWYQFFSRHYDVQAVQERILNKAPALKLTLYKVENFRILEESGYLRWIGVFEKRQNYT